MNKVKLSVFGLSLLALSIAIYSCSKSEEDLPDEYSGQTEPLNPGQTEPLIPVKLSHLRV
jgi:hypothetical protein